MKHYIIGKFTPEVQDKAAVIAEVTKLYADAAAIPGVRGAEVIPNVIARPNRYDVMIVLDMDEAALIAWDNSDIHHAWKDTYGTLLEKKCIFDAE